MTSSARAVPKPPADLLYSEENQSSFACGRYHSRARSKSSSLKWSTQPPQSGNELFTFSIFCYGQSFPGCVSWHPIYSEEDTMPIIRTCPHCGQKNRIPAKLLTNSGRCGVCKSPLPPLSEPLAVDAALFDEIVRNARVPILVDFWAQWCGPCHAAAPEVSQTAADMAGKAIVLKVDTEKYPQLAGRFQVRSIPNFVVLFGGRVVMQQAGLVSRDHMEQWLRSATAVSA